MSEPPRRSPRDILRQLLDGGFDATARVVNQAYVRELQSGILRQRLDELLEEAGRLAETGRRLRPDNPVLRALLADLDDVLVRQTRLIEGVASELQASGVDAARSTARLFTLGEARLGAAFNVPDPRTLAQVVDFVTDPAFTDELASLPADVLASVRRAVVQGVASGQGPHRIARHITDLVETFPRARANTLMRTLQLESYRRTDAAIALANSDVIDRRIRIATLDDRTCLACIALHGTELRTDESVDDHHRGRCIALNVARGATAPVSRRVIEGRVVEFRTGQEWFDALPDTRRLTIAGPANFEALSEGVVRLDDFVQPYSDPLFGDMIRQASLKGVLGSAAQAYYAQ